MPNVELNARIKHKRDSEDNWSANNPILLNGEIGIVDREQESDIRFKIGDGVSTYNNLEFINPGVPSGAIILYSGSTIPDAWVLCDGNNGTPDLTDRFVIGAGKNYQVNDTGGEVEHVLTVDELPEHNHTLSGDSIINSKTNGTVTIGVGGYFTTTSKFETLNTTDIIGNGNAHNNMPPYYALYYIMKI